VVILVAIFHYLEVKSVTLAGAVTATSFFIFWARDKKEKKQGETKNEKV